MAKKKSAPKRSQKQTPQQKQGPQRLANQRIHVAGKGKKYETQAETIINLCKEEGALIQKAVDSDTDYLITMAVGFSAAKKKAESLNKKQNSSIAVLDHSALVQQLVPNEDDVVQFIAAGEAGIAHLSQILHLARLFHGGLTGCEAMALRGMDLSGFEKFNYISIDGADLREANLDRVHADVLYNADLRKSHGEHFYAAGFVGSDCRGASWPGFFLDRGYGGSKDVQDSDFSNANLSRSYWSMAETHDSKFCKAILTEWRSRGGKFVNCDLSGADLSKSEFQRHRFSKSCKLVGTKFINADLAGTNFGDSDLSRADFTGAQLNGCDFSKCTLKGTNFKDAFLLNSNFGKADTSKAKNLKLPTKTKVKTGAACKALETAIHGAEEFTLQAVVDSPDGPVTISARVSSYTQEVQGGYEIHDRVIREEEKSSTGYVYERESFKDKMSAPSLSSLLKQLGEVWGHGQLNLETVKTKGKKCALKGKALADAAVAALSEVFGVVAGTEELKAKRQSSKAKTAELKAELIKELQGGKSGIDAFQARDAYELRRKKLYSFRGEDFSGCKFTGLKVREIDFGKCDFSSANLSKVELDDAKLDQCSFRKANLRQAHLDCCKLAGSNFENANLSQAKIEWSNLSKCNFTGANFKKAKIAETHIGGADFLTANLDGATFVEVIFDEKTVFPQDYEIPEELIFQGVGHDPRKQAAALPDRITTFEGYLEAVMSWIDHARLDKAMAMLKKDSFQLFSDVSDNRITGVVRSQSDPNLVYSCSLDANGEFACCTQNLNVCGGLRGSLCKHLLVLMVGLSKGAEIELETAAQWMAASCKHKPNLDKDAMSEVLLKYKGAEAGELDWRPTETVPEDYLAF